MKFLLDENIGKIEDFEVLEFAVSLNAIIVTSDRDFGELVFKWGYPHKGIIFLRLKDQTSENKIKALKKVVSTNKDLSNFLVVTEQDEGFKIRIRTVN